MSIYVRKSVCCCNYLFVLLLLFLCDHLKSVKCFNLETRIPIIKVGHTGSYFGYSVAQHQDINEENNSTINWLLIGAPLDNNKQPNTSRSGALWKCPLTTSTDDCEQVLTDGRRTKGGTYSEPSLDSDELRPPHNDEIKNGQWLGVSVRSQGRGRKVVVCAHRYTRIIVDSHYGQGLCYILNSELSYDDAWEPCKGRPIKKDHEEYGFCQAGTSSYLLDDGVLLVGTPGPYNWRGTVFTRDIKDDIFQRDQNIYQGPVLEKDSPVDSYSYLGMSVTGARFFNKDNMSYAAGAPRSEGTGQVVLYSKPYGVWSNTFLNVTLMLDGEQFGSSFGYEVATADTNGDGKPDLLVAAPFYFKQNAGGAVYLYLNDNFNLNSKADVKITGQPESQFGFAIANAGDLNKDGCDDIAIGSPYDGNGVVFIYLGHRSKGLDTTAKQMIKAEDLPLTLKTFGYSLSGGMDLDENGYPDLLVGAYQEGSVALLRGRPIIDIKTFVSANSTLKNIDPSRRGCEKDPSSNHTCFTFETCCTIESLVKPTTQNTLRLNYVIEAETFQGGRKFSRVFFGGSTASQRSNIKNKTIELTKNNRMHCEEHTVYIKENTRDIQSAIKVKYLLVQPAPVWQSRGPLPPVDAQPVLNATASTAFSAAFLNDCGTDALCQSDLRLEAELALPNADRTDTYILTLGREDEIRLVVTADNLGESAYEAQLFVSHQADLNYIAANVTDKHIICNLHNETMVICSLGNPFKRQLPEPGPITLRFDPKLLNDLELAVDFLVWANSTSKEITGNKPPVRVEALVVKNAELSIKGNAHPEQVFYGGEVRGESAMHYLDDIGSRVLHTYEVFNAGPWRVPSVEVVVEWPHQVANDKTQGKWLLYLDDKPTVEAQEGGDCIVKDESLYVNPLRLKQRPGVQEAPLENLIKLDPALERAKWSRIEKDSSFNTTAKKERGQSSAVENKIRRRRDSEMVIKAEAYTDSNGQRHQVVNMDCRKNTAKCIKISCMVYRLARNQVATISVYARLWNSTLVEDYPRVGRVNIASHASIHLPSHYNIMQAHNDDDDVTVETVAYPDLVAGETSGVPLWVIVVSVLLGLLVLVLLVLALWRLGFFKRSRPDPTLSANLEKHHQDQEGSPFLATTRNSLR